MFACVCLHLYVCMCMFECVCLHTHDVRIHEWPTSYNVLTIYMNNSPYTRMSHIVYICVRVCAEERKRVCMFVDVCYMTAYTLCTHTYMCACVCERERKRVYLCLSMYDYTECTRTYIYMYLHIHIYTHIFLYKCVCVSMYTKCASFERFELWVQGAEFSLSLSLSLSRVCVSVLSLGFRVLWELSKPTN